ncbi:MAG: WG repeat-containing protein [Bacteroides sp.]|nr:WG repeat-containing protein [Bacteroides sp.]
MAKRQTKNSFTAISVSEMRKLMAVEHNGKWGFLDPETGEEVVPFIYDYAHSFSVGLALVRLNGWWGYVDKTGKEVIPCIYKPAYSFIKTGLAAVCVNDKYDFID